MELVIVSPRMMLNHLEIIEITLVEIFMTFVKKKKKKRQFSCDALHEFSCDALHGP